MELDRRRSSGTAKAGLATGIVGTALGTLGLLGNGANMVSRTVDNIQNAGWPNAWGNGWNGGWFGPGFGWGGFGGYGYGFGTPQTVVVNSNDESGRTRNGHYYDHEGGCCSEDHYVNRYELELQKQIAEKDSAIALRDANTYGDQKLLEVYKYFDGKLEDVHAELARQAVINQKTEDSFALVKQDVDCCCRRLETAIATERNERKCADNTIITYTNATFYPIQRADITTGTTTTTQATYNPLPCSNNCNCGNN